MFISVVYDRDFELGILVCDGDGISVYGYAANGFLIICRIGIGQACGRITRT
jgi:hypothetical protein